MMIQQSVAHSDTNSATIDYVLSARLLLTTLFTDSKSSLSYSSANCRSSQPHTRTILSIAADLIPIDSPAAT